MAALRELGDAAAIVPTGEVGPGSGEGSSIDLRHFRDATVRSPTTWDPTDTWRYYAELLDGASAFKSFVYVGPSKEVMAAMRREIESVALDLIEAYIDASEEVHPPTSRPRERRPRLIER